MTAGEPCVRGKSQLHRARILVLQGEFLLRLELETVLGQAGATVRTCNGSIRSARSMTAILRQRPAH